MHQYKIRYLENHFNPPSQQEWRKILPSPKRFPSRNGARRRKKHRPAPLGGTSNEIATFFEGALLPGTEAGRARASSRTAHILPKRGRESTAGANSTPATRSPVSTPSITSQSFRRNKTGNSNRKSPKIAGFTSRERANEFRNKHGHGSSSKRGVAPSGWSFGSLHQKLETDIQRSVDSGHSFRIQNGVSRISSTKSHSPGHTSRSTEGTSLDKGGEGSSRKRSYPKDFSQQGRFYKPTVPRTKVRRIMATSHQPQSLKQICDYPALQDGICENSKGINAEKGLDDKARSERCLPLSAHSPGTPKIPEVSVAGVDMAISVSPIRPEQRTIRVHKAHETDGIHTTKARNSSSPVPGRYANNGKIKAACQDTPSHSHAASIIPWVHNQSKEKHTLPNTGVGISRIHPKFQQNDDLITISQIALTKEISQEDEGSRGDIHPGNSTDSWNDGSNSSSNPSSATTLQTTGGCQVNSTKEWQIIRLQDAGRSQHEGRLELVDTACQFTQWSLPTDYPMGSHDRVRCLHEGLGCQLRGEEYRRPLDGPRDILSYQLFGAACSLFGPKVICLTPGFNLDLVAPGQCHCDCLSEQDGWHTFSTIVEPGTGDLELVHRQEDSYTCRASPRKIQCQSRLGITALDRFHRLDAPTGDFSRATNQARAIHNRLICFKDQFPAPSILQLEARPGSSGSGCTVDLLEGSLSIHVSPICSYSSLSTQDRRGTCDSTFSCPSVVEPNLVSNASQVSDRFSNSASFNSRHCDQSTRPQSSAGNQRSSPSSRMACLGQSYRSEGLSEGVISIIRQSWRSSTESAYSSAWRQWDSWCLTRNIDPLSAPLNSILEFLLEQFNMGKQYRTINTLRSAISMTHDEVDGTRIGQHPLVSRFLKGVFNNRPPAPRYSSTWDVDVVLNYIMNLPHNEQLSFQCLSHKLAMLMALSNADRCSDLVALDLNFRAYTGDGVRFVIPGLTKTRRNGPPLEVFYPSFPENPHVCPVTTLQCYECKSKELRTRHATRNPLFISVRKPHKPVKAATVGHWLKAIMKSAGIDTNTFSAHSTRGAATSKAKRVGVSTSDILKAANWSSSSTFCRFYHRPLYTGRFGSGVLRQQQTLKHW